MTAWAMARLCAAIPTQDQDTNIDRDPEAFGKVQLQGQGCRVASAIVTEASWQMLISLLAKQACGSLGRFTPQARM